LHGWQSSSFRWKQLVEYMKDEQYTIYALDAPGHGQTGGNFLNLVVYAKLIKTFVEQVNGVQAIVAHSIGGFATVFALHQFPDLVVDKAIIMGAPGEVSDFIVHLKGYTGFSDKVIEAIEQHFIQTLGQPPVYFSARAFGKTLQQPALIVHDEQDLDASVAYAKALYNNMPRAELHLTKGLGHALRSDELMERIQKFIDN
jgi:pimeloyl-ACP methyl ester carboxylesterase